MVRPDGYVKILDFGVARLSRKEQDPSTAETMVRTSEGQLLGTGEYMSPEQGKARTVTPATDIFSLGIVLYEMATGVHPFLAQAKVSVLHAIIAQEPIPPSRLNPEIPAWFQGLLLRMLAKEASERPTAEQVIRELEIGRQGDAATPAQSGGSVRFVVGREAERRALRAALDTAQRERRQHGVRRWRSRHRKDDVSRRVFRGTGRR